MIIQAAYAACKALIANPLRAVLREILGGLHVVQTGGSPPDRSELAYRAKKTRCQALGYLLVDQTADKIPELFHSPPSHLFENERAMLFQMHSELVDLNRKCVASVVTQFPSSRIALDPYSRYVEATGKGLDGERFIVDASVDAIVTAFRSHPGIQILAGGILARMPVMSEHDFVNQTLSLASVIGKAGLANTPSQLQKIAFGTPRDDPRRVFVKGIASLLTVCASLYNLNQMLFQAIEEDKPPILNEDNIIHIANAQTNLSGPSVSVTFQPDDMSLFVQPGDLVLLKEVPKAVPVSGLTTVNDTHFEHTEYGAIHRVGLRILNPWLSPYGTLETLL